MTQSAIIENCHRLMMFYNRSNGLMKDFIQIKEWMNARPPSCEELVSLYGRILDVNGAYKIGVSLLFLDYPEYEELREWATKKAGFLDFPEASIARPRSFTFEYDGYEWLIKLTTNVNGYVKQTDNE